MGFLDRNKRKSKTHGLLRLPNGCFSVDRDNRLVVSTLPSTFPMQKVEHIGRTVLEAFRGAAACQIPLREMTINFGTLRITARELRGGAIIYLIPSSLIRGRGSS
jgi:hypothetical protein